MNYTEVYNKIYKAISNANLSHEKAHNASVRITDALNDIFVYTKMQFPEIMEEVMDIVGEFSSSIKNSKE
ncbi:MAG: hypothetical protein RLZZ196_2764 [Bacteroidota bacterium]|jgi:hypothetical protein